MREDLTDIVIVLDVSGSMENVKDVVKDGINKLIRDERNKAGEATLSLYTFAFEYTVLMSRVPLKSAEFGGFWADGGTALLGGLGKAIDDHGAKLAALPEEERPARVLIAVFTDGKENTSQTRDWSLRYFDNAWTTVRTMVLRQQQVYNWRFVYMGVNGTQDSDPNAEYKLGMSNVPGSSLMYEAGREGTQVALNAFTKSVGAYRQLESKTSGGIGFFQKDDLQPAVPAIQSGPAVVVPPPQAVIDPQATPTPALPPLTPRRLQNFHNLRDRAGRFASKANVNP